jgi:hypothetical protein
LATLGERAQHFTSIGVRDTSRHGAALGTGVVGVHHVVVVGRHGSIIGREETKLVLTGKTAQRRASYRRR